MPVPPQLTQALHDTARAYNELEDKLHALEAAALRHRLLDLAAEHGLTGFELEITSEYDDEGGYDRCANLIGLPEMSDEVQDELWDAAASYSTAAAELLFEGCEEEVLTLAELAQREFGGGGRDS